MKLSAILFSCRDQISDKWANHLYRTQRYKRVHSSKEEVSQLTKQITDAIYVSVKKKDFSGIDSWAESIARLTLDNGMKLSAVQKDCLYYRDLIFPIVVKELEKKELMQAIKRLNRSIAHMVSRFSVYFEELHFKEIKDYTENLEQKIVAGSRDLADSEAKYRTLVEEINDGYFVNLDDRIVFANRAFCEMHGYMHDELIGMHYWDLVALESQDQNRTYYNRRMAGLSTPLQYTFFRRHKDGSSLPTENKVAVIIYDGKLAAAGICRDIAERVKMEQRIRASESLATIGQLTTSLAHEIRNPLSSIKMSIQLAIDGLPDGLDEKQGLQISMSELYRLERIVSEMLDYAKPLALNLRPASMNNVVESALSALECRFRQKYIQVKKKLSDTVLTSPLDPDKMEQAVINVLLNAIEAVEEGGTVKVMTGMAERGQKVKVRIADNGPGVKNQADLKHIFDPFFTKKKKTGTGLGLVNVKRVIDAHKGSVKAENTRQGFCLSIMVPSDNHIGQEG